MKYTRLLLASSAGLIAYSLYALAAGLAAVSGAVGALSLDMDTLISGVLGLFLLCMGTLALNILRLLTGIVGLRESRSDGIFSPCLIWGSLLALASAADIGLAYRRDALAASHAIAALLPALYLFCAFRLWKGANAPQAESDLPPDGVPQQKECAQPAANKACEQAK